MIRPKLLLFLFSLSCLTASSSFAQVPAISAEDVRVWIGGNRNVRVVDTRLPEEYQEGHIPGAINIPAERMRMEAGRLPSDKNTPVIFYCRGAG